MKKREETRDLLLEIGCEELPSIPLNRVVEQIRVQAPALMSEAQLAYTDLKVFATPRRIALLMTGIPLKVPDQTTEYKGPAVAVGYQDADPSKPATKALEGFARGKGVSLTDIEVREVDGVAYTFATVTTVGRATKEVLPALLSTLITGLDWEKTQRWGSGVERFARPVRWLVALFGSEVLPVDFGGLSSGRFTRGHRFLAPQRVEVTLPKEYVHVLKGNKVIADQDKRRAIIEAQAREVAAERGTVLLDEEVLSEDINLTEYPHAALGTFDADFLRAPREILEYAMAKHQRYFAVQRADGSLDNTFVVVTNSDPAFETQVVAGHERVIRARLADAVFFYDEDLKIPLDAWREKLADIVFQDRLGTVAQKSDRIERLVGVLSEVVGLDEDARQSALAAARLAKADLATSVVVEFPHLQGVVGSYYALAQGEDAETARAIREHYQPRFSDDAHPSTLVGRLVSIADKMDTIAGIFAAGKAPKGSSDPFALRRSAIGVIGMLMQDPVIDLDGLTRHALESYQDILEFDFDRVHDEIRRFFASRLGVILKDEGVSSEVVSAVLARAAHDPADASQRAQTLQEFSSHDDMVNLSTALKRAKNLSQPEAGLEVDTSLLSAPENALYSAVTSVERDEAQLIAQHRYRELLTRFADLRTPLDVFFDEVMVMDSDESLRNNRLALLNRLVRVVERFGDLTKLVVKK